MENIEYTYSDISNEKISDKAIAICAINGALRTKGIAGLSGGITNSISENLWKKESASKGVRIEKEKDGIILHIYAIVEYGYKIPNVAWELQENVKREVEDITEKKVKKVNVDIERVELSRR